MASGARFGAIATAAEVLVSCTVKDLAASSALGFIDRGCTSCKGYGMVADIRAVRVAPVADAAARAQRG